MPMTSPSTTWPRKWGWRWVFLCFAAGGAVEFAVLGLYEQAVGRPPAWLIVMLNALWTISVGLAIRGARTRICPACGKTASTSRFRIGQRICDQCGQRVA